MTKNNESASLKIMRKFNAAPHDVFDAFTKPEAMRVWWTDDTVFDIDLRVGGTWTITRKEGGVIYTMTGKYLEIDRPHRLLHTIGMPQFSPNFDTVSIDIAPDGKNGSIFTFEQTGEDIAAELRALPEGSTSESEIGWQQGFDMMAQAWEEKK